MMIKIDLRSQETFSESQRKKEHMKVSRQVRAGLTMALVWAATYVFILVSKGDESLGVWQTLAVIAVALLAVASFSFAVRAQESKKVLTELPLNLYEEVRELAKNAEIERYCTMVGKKRQNLTIGEYWAMRSWKRMVDTKTRNKALEEARGSVMLGKAVAES